MAEEEEESLAEIKAVQAVYGDDCVVLESIPPHIRLHIKPRTADVSSDQFVEALIGIKAGSKYPDEPPRIDIVDSKGLDEERKSELARSVRNKASELAGYLMLVALCEEAVEKLSYLNHPEGDCPLCLYPLVSEDDDDKSLPFMKLMSCFHCFHSECIIRWWNWLQVQNNLNPSELLDQQDTPEEIKGGMGTCPMCRKVFHIEDFEHVLSLAGSQMSSLNFTDSQVDNKVDDKDLLESEKIRRQKFEEILKKQEENSGLIEPPKDLVVLPGMYLPQPTPSPATAARSATESVEGHIRNSINSRSRNKNKTAPRDLETSNSAANRAGPSQRRNHGMKNHQSVPVPVPSTAPMALPTTEVVVGQIRDSNSLGNRNRRAIREIESSNLLANKPSPSHGRNHSLKNHRPINVQRQAKQQWVQKSGEPTS